jgi:hypothetical protein
VRRQGSWKPEAYVKAIDTAFANCFSYGLALGGGGNLLAVGAPAENGISLGNGGSQAQGSATSYAKAAHVHSRCGAVWSHYKASDAAPNN